MCFSPVGGEFSFYGILQNVLAEKFCVFKLLFESDDLTSGKWYVKGYDSSGTEVTYPENAAANIANGFAFDPENGNYRGLQMHYRHYIPGNGTGSFDGGEIRVTLQRTE